MRRLFLLAACALAFILGVASTLAVLSYTQRLTSKAQVKVMGVSIYKDKNFTIPLTEIDWGILEPGQSKNSSAYIVNKSNVPITLTMKTENWTPTNASSFITLTWNYAATTIAVGSYVYVTFVLTVNSAISGITVFTFTIVITGSG